MIDYKGSAFVVAASAGEAGQVIQVYDTQGLFIKSISSVDGQVALFLQLSRGAGSAAVAV